MLVHLWDMETEKREYTNSTGDWLYMGTAFTFCGIWASRITEDATRITCEECELMKFVRDAENENAPCR